MKKVLKTLELLLILATSYFWGAVCLAAETAYVREETRDLDCRVFRILWHTWNVICYTVMPVYSIVCVLVARKRMDLFNKCMRTLKKESKVNYFTLYSYKWWMDIFRTI